MGSEVLGVPVRLVLGPLKPRAYREVSSARLGASQAASVLLQLSRRLGSRWDQPGSGASVLFSS